MQRPARRRDISIRRTGRRPAERNNANADAARLPRIISAIRRGELGLTKPARPRGSFLLLGPTGVGKTETVVVTTAHVFGSGQLFRFDMSEFQNQEALGLLLGARLGEVGYLGGVRERASEGSLLFDEAEKAHPRVLDIMLQLLDAARITVATGQTLDFSGFYIWLTSNIGSAELMSLQHSNDARSEEHTSELQSLAYLVCRLLLEKKKK